MASSSRGRFVVVLVLCLLLLVYLQDVDARGSRVRGSSSRNRKLSQNPARLPKPFRHRVTKTQLVKEQRPFHQRFDRNALIGVQSYIAFKGPKYAGYYAANPNLNITIPKQRALVIAKDEFKVVNADGRNCSARGNLTKNLDDTRNVLNVTTTVSYEHIKPNDSAPAIANQNYFDSKIAIVFISPDALDKFIVTVETLTRFNQSVVDGNSLGENCTVILFKTKAYLIEINSAFPIAVDMTMILLGFAAAHLVELNL